MSTTRRDFLKTTIPLLATQAAVSSTLAQTPNDGTTAITIDPQPEAKPKRPNILFLFPDQHRFDWLGSNPELPLRVPNIDSIAKRGVRFGQAFCPSPLCAPSRATLASGREYDHAGVAGNNVDYPFEQPAFYASLRDAGYHVLGCGKFDLHKKTLFWGLDGKHWIDRYGFTNGIDSAGKWAAFQSGQTEPKDPYMALLYEKGLAETHLNDFRRRKEEGNYKSTFPTPLPDEAYSDNFVAENGLKLIRSVPKGESWFLQVNFPGPHEPVDITKRMEKQARLYTFPQPNQSTEFDAATHNAIRQNYAAMLENIDHWIGIYLQEIYERGELDNTLIIYSSDHGEMLGDHNLWAKSKPYQPSVGVPLIFAGPGIESGSVSDALVSHIDVGPTILEYAGAKPLKDIDGHSLVSLLAGRTTQHQTYVRSGLGSWRLVFDGRYKFVRGYPKPDDILLFDLQKDPLENHNLAEDPSAKKIIEHLRQLV